MGYDYLTGVPNMVRLLYLEVSKLADPTTIADVEESMQRLIGDGMRPMDFIDMAKSGC